ncbi:MAG: VOC family protein [Candidatus Zixiibacteriota bacterium]|nr:MAG: VOC family protein [candidate division Zixibacteria bacterium]
MNGICHFEIPCSDLNKAVKFYGDIFGWKSQMIPEMDYAVFETPAGTGGGFSKDARVSSEAGIMLYIEVEDIPVIMKKIEASGGKQIKEKTQISPEHGYFGLFADSEGNMVGLWSKS